MGKYNGPEKRFFLGVPKGIFANQEVNCFLHYCENTLFTANLFITCLSYGDF